VSGAGIARRLLVLALFLLPIAVLLSTHLPPGRCSIRGEHWALLYRYVEDAPIASKIRNVALFAFPGVQRPQLLAFFVPGVPFALFGVDPVGHALFACCLHVLAGLFIVLILGELGVGPGGRFCAFSMFLLSFACSETVNWAFFSYIQLNTILVLASLHLLMKFESTGRLGYFHLQTLCIGVACFLYEISAVVFVVQMAYLLWFRTEKWAHCLLVLSGAVLCVVMAVAMVFGGWPNEADANKVFHLGILYRSLVFVRNLGMYVLGFHPMAVEVRNIVTLANEVVPPFWSAFNACVLLAAIASGSMLVRGSGIAMRDQRTRRLVFLCLGILGAYVVGLCFGRVRSAEAFVRNAYFDAQFRYYYLPVAVSVLLGFVLARSPGRRADVVAVLALGVMVSGNVMNTCRLNELLAPCCTESSRTLEHAAAFLRATQVPVTSGTLVEAYVYLWTKRAFPLVERSCAPFVYNASKPWARAPAARSSARSPPPTPAPPHPPE
jgi:hypothetical protein